MIESGDWRRLWVVSWVGLGDGVERDHECRTRAQADELVFRLMSGGRCADVKIDGAAC